MKALVCVALFTVILTGCNVLDVVDPPSNDYHYLSAARACFDRGDYTCATKYYSKLSSNNSDTGHAEKALELLAQYGVTSANLMTVVISSGGSAGKLITQLGGLLTSQAGETARIAMFHAYQEHASISDTRTKGLIRFLTALSITAELLAENAQTSGRVKKSDLVVDPTPCLAAAPLYVLSSSCGAPSAGRLITGTSISLATATDATMAGSPTLYMINSAIDEISSGLSQMQGSGSISSSSGTFSAALLAVALVPGTESRAYRAALVANGIGDD